MEDISSLFNYRDPRSMRADQYAAQMQAPSGDLDQMTVQLGGNAGSLIGNALFGGQTSKMAEQSVLNEAIKESEVATDPDERLSLFSQALRKRGLEGYAQKVDAQLQGRMKEKSAAEAANQQQAALTRLVMSKTGLGQEEAAALAKDPATVRELMKETQAKVSTFGQQLIDAGMQPGSPEFQAQMQKFINNELTPKKGIGEQIAAGLSPIMNKMAGVQAEKAAAAGGQEVGKATATIRTGEKSLEALKNAKDMLGKGIYAGGYGPLSEKAAKYTGGIVGSRDRVANTEEFRSYIGSTVMPMMAQLGGSDSNEELKKMEAIMAANTTLEPEAMNNIIDSAIKAVERDIKKVQDQQKAIETGQPLPTSSAGRTATKRWNPKTQKLETITR